MEQITSTFPFQKWSIYSSEKYKYIFPEKVKMFTLNNFHQGFGVQ